MAVHRSPGARARRHATPRPAVGATRAGAAAALGAVTTGAFTALIPAVDAPVPVAAEDVSTPSVATTLASVSIPIKIDEDGHHTSKGAFVPVRSVADGAADTPGEAQLAQLDKAAGIATRIAEMAAKQQAEQAERAKVDALIAKGGLDGWIAEALRVMDLPQSLAPAVKKIIMKESTGNPNAINRWDANAQRGTPSQGLMQTIPSTFRKFVHPSLADKSITHPVANITAGVRYMIATYGLRTLEQGGRRSAAGHYVGY
ncbi:transglycosylase SLT domain-containing protein [Pseudonocardia sp.]|uniref:transglycosylase SLT domain-containing protein n=1 Tax=Pseudonocardia sp. TaxID=60912 RepID=UPI003D0CDED2